MFRTSLFGQPLPIGMYVRSRRRTRRYGASEEQAGGDCGALMSIGYRSIPRLGLIVEVWDGVITVDQWRAHVDRYLSDPERLSGDRSIVDVTTADATAIGDADEAEVVAKYLPHASELAHRRSAVIAAREFKPSFEFGRRIERLGLKVIVFNELTGACTWLGLDSADVHGVIQDLRAHLRDEMSL